MPIWVRRHPRSEFSQDAATLQPTIATMAAAATGLFALAPRPARAYRQAVFSQDAALIQQPPVFSAALFAALGAFAPPSPRRLRSWPSAVPFIQDFAFDLGSEVLEGAYETFFARPPRRQRLHTHTVPDDGWIFKALPTPFDTTINAAWSTFWSRPPRRQRLYPDTVFEDGWLFTANQYNPATLLHQFWARPPRRLRLHPNTVFDEGWLFAAQPPPFDTTLDAAWYLFWSAPPRRQRLYPSTVPDDGWLTVNVPPPPPVSFVGGWVQQGPAIVRKPPRVWASGMFPGTKPPGT